MSETIDARLTPIMHEMLAAGLTLRQVMDAIEGKAISVALERTNGRVVRAAQMLGMHRNTLHSRLGPRSELQRRAGVKNATARWRR